jgi:selenide,water dikinase
VENPHLLVGLGNKEDSGVYKISDELALVQTIDFFTPVVDDPYDYGQIAVANSLSDIYAMGATPLTALNVVGFPIATLSKNILAQILKGGWDKAQEAGVLILGGHSVKDPEIKYGLAVTALSHPDKIIRNNTVNNGDKLILTKPLGTGILTTALKYEKLPDHLLDIVTRTMKRLSNRASQIMMKYEVTACTDVTGFGFLGHLLEMVEASHLTAHIDSSAVPLLPEVLKYIEEKQIPGGLKENLKYLNSHIYFPAHLPDILLKALCDPQTSGGLLFTVPPSRVNSCLEELKSNGETAAVVGEIRGFNKKSIVVT